MAQKTASAKKKNTVTVKILNQEYKLATDSSPERAIKAAKFLNDQIREIHSKSSSMPEFKALVLAALNVTDKYYSLQDRHSTFKQQVVERSQSVLELLEDATPQS